MIHFLDFDRALFDTDAFNASLADEPACASFSEEIRDTIAKKRDETLTGGAGRTATWEKVSEVMRSGALSFPAGALERFLYPDVPEFLRMLGNEAIIVTFGEPLRQKMKVESALGNVVRVTALYTDYASKAEYLSTWPGYYGQQAVFVDDRVAELEELAKRFPALKLFEIRRDEKEGDGRWPVIRTLHDLP